MTITNNQYQSQDNAKSTLKRPNKRSIDSIADILVNTLNDNHSTQDVINSFTALGCNLLQANALYHEWYRMSPKWRAYPTNTDVYIFIRNILIRGRV